MSKIKEDQRKILQECKEEVMKHLGMEKLPETKIPMVGFKYLVERLVRANAKRQ